MKTYYGFLTVDGEAVWFHKKDTAKQFGKVCGFGEWAIVTSSAPDSQDIMDTEEEPWSRLSLESKT